MLAMALISDDASAGAAESGKELTLWTFDYGMTNSLGGEYNTYSKSPSWARTYLDPDVHHSDAGHSLRITVHREAEGFCGVWLDFFPKSLDPRQYFDATPYRYLSFWVKGDRGGEKFDIALSDTNLREERAPKRPLGRYLASGAATEWQAVSIPLGDFPGLDLRRLTEMTIQISDPTNERFYLDDIEFTFDPAKPPATATLRPDAVPSNRHAVWVWNTKGFFDPVNAAAASNRFFDFVKSQGIREVYFAVGFESRGTTSAPRYELKEAGHVRDFLARAHGLGLEVEALAGTPEWAARENHAHALAAVDAVLDFNRASPAAGRFDGLHFDVEPYSLVGYAAPSYRKEVLTEYLEMIAQVTEKVKADSRFVFGCDAPAWFYPSGGAERAAMTVSFQGAEKSVGEHLSDLVDTVTIMDYRNEADGAGGIVMAGTPALTYASAGHKKILVGLETSEEADRTIYFVCGLPLAEFEARITKSPLRNQFYFGDFRLAVFSDGINIHLGLHAPETLEGPRRAGFEKALAALAKDFGASSDPARFNVQAILGQARAALGSDAEWRGFEVLNLTDPDTHQSIAGFKSVHVMLPKETFFGLGRPVFDEETRSVVEWLGRYPSFAGLAIHYYESFRDLVEGK